MCQQLFSSLATKRVTREAKAVSELAIGIIDRVTELSEGKALPGVATGIPTIDSMLGGGLKPASKAHAWHRARELSQESPELFSGIDEALKEAMSNTQTGETK